MLIGSPTFKTTVQALALLSAALPWSRLQFCFFTLALLSGKYLQPASAASCSEPVGDQRWLAPPTCVKRAKNRNVGQLSADKTADSVKQEKRKAYCTHLCFKLCGHWLIIVFIVIQYILISNHIYYLDCSATIMSAPTSSQDVLKTQFGNIFVLNENPFKSLIRKWI